LENELDILFTNSELFEGDIENVDVSLIDTDSEDGGLRNAIRGSYSKWRDNTVPYVISGSYNSRERRIIMNAMEEYHKNTCLRFKKRTNERGYIDIKRGGGCSSSVGRTGRGQQVSLANGCVSIGIVIHELMHAVGFWHEQSRADRDNYVTIQYDNIHRGMAYNFQKYGLEKIDHLGAEYDYCSVMHYSLKAFSKNGRKTIVPKRSLDKCSRIGQRSGFSDTDIRKINTLYQCSGYKQVGGGGGGGSIIKPPPTPKPITETDEYEEYDLDAVDYPGR